MCGHLMMSQKERERKVVLELVKSKHLSVQEAAYRLGLSYRQTLRIRKRYHLQGDAGLLHRHRGRASNRRFDPILREKILTYYRSRLLGFSPTFSKEKLALVGLNISTEGLRKLLMQEGLWQPKKRRTKYRTRRPRRQNFGELVQMDGSFHDWFGDGQQYCLMNMVDDSSSITLAQLHEEETTKAAMSVLWAWIEKYGIPQALYTDKKNVYITDREPTLEEQLADEKPLTAFGKCCQRLGIEIITAHSPQAKGRVERNHGVYQDRWIKELSFQNIKTLPEANRHLREHFCDDLNQRFAVEGMKDQHRGLGEINLYEMFVWKEDRVVSQDWTIRYQNKIYQITKRYRGLKPKKKVQVVTHLDGELSLEFKGKKVDFERLNKAKVKALLKVKKKKEVSSWQRSQAGKKGAKNSPWRTYNPAWLKGKKEHRLTHRVHSP